MLPPREIVALAVERGLSGLSITDHDTVAGQSEAAAMAGMLGVHWISGVELTCTAPDGDRVHLLGYCFDPDDPGLTTLLETIGRTPGCSVRWRPSPGYARSGSSSLWDDVLEHSGGPSAGTAAHRACHGARWRDRDGERSVRPALDGYRRRGARVLWPAFHWRTPLPRCTELVASLSSLIPAREPPTRRGAH